MKLFAKLFLLTGTFASLSHASSLRTGNNPSLYYTPQFSATNPSCDSRDLKPVLSPDKNVLVSLCARDYKKCLFEGACLIETPQGGRLGISFYKYSEAENQSYFEKINLEKCPFGYGVGKISPTEAASTCLIPYVSVSADPLAHSLGEVIYVPALKGLPLPTGEVHDGYLIISDSSTDSIDTGLDQFAFYTGVHPKKDPQNAFAATLLGNPDNEYPYEVITGPVAEEIRQKRHFTLVKTFPRVFKPKANEMIGN